MSAADTDSKPSTYSAEERLARVDVLLFAVFCVATCGSSRADDPNNEDTIVYLTSMARDEVGNLQNGLTAGNAMNIDCGA